MLELQGVMGGVLAAIPVDIGQGQGTPWTSCQFIAGLM